MTSSISKTQSFRWELKDFRSHWDKNRNKDVISDSFNIGPFCFSLFYHNSNINFYSNTYGIVLKNIVGKELVGVSLKLWLQNDEGQKFCKHSSEKCILDKVDEKLRFSLAGGNDWDLFCKVKDYRNKTLYICSKFTDLNDQSTVPKTDCTQQFHQSMWSMYEQEVHDAIIKIGNTKFKISKFPFMSHSEVFKNMFLSNFKEGRTSTVDVKDVSEKTMNQMIKWMYTCQMEDKSVVEDLYEAADKYQINLLKINCAEVMINSLNNTNVFRRFILAVAHNDTQLKNFSLAYIDKMSNNEVIGYFMLSSEWNEFILKNPVIANEVKKIIAEKLKK